MLADIACGFTAGEAAFPSPADKSANPEAPLTGSESNLWILLMNSMTLGKIRVCERVKRHYTQYEATED
jgi:hypothetical protein